MAFKKGDVCEQIDYLDIDENKIVIITSTRTKSGIIGHRHVYSKGIMFTPEITLKKIDMTKEEFEQMEVENEI